MDAPQIVALAVSGVALTISAASLWHSVLKPADIVLDHLPREVRLTGEALTPLASAKSADHRTRVRIPVAVPRSLQGLPSCGDFARITQVSRSIRWPWRWISGRWSSPRS